jgi:hypothetical protein
MVKQAERIILGGNFLLIGYTVYVQQLVYRDISDLCYNISVINVHVTYIDEQGYSTLVYKKANREGSAL